MESAGRLQHEEEDRAGGFQGRKSDGEPGAETLWRGLQLLSTMAGLWRVMSSP